MQSSQNPIAPIAKFELTINGELKKFAVWPSQLPKAGGNPFHRVELDKPKEGNGNYHNSPKPYAPDAPKSQWPSGNGPSVYTPQSDYNQKKADELSPAIELDDLPF